MIGNNSGFAIAIEDIVWEKDCEYIEALLIFCEQKGIEPESISKMILSDPVLLGKITNEAEIAKIIKGTTKLSL